MFDITFVVTVIEKKYLLEHSCNLWMKILGLFVIRILQILKYIVHNIKYVQMLLNI